MTMLSGTVSNNTDATATQYNNLRKDLALAGGDFATSGGSANAQTISLDAQITAYVTGMLVKFKAGFTNTGATTVNVNSIGANTIKKVDGTDLKPSDILSGGTYFLLYNGTNFMLINPMIRGGGEFGDGSDGAMALDGTNTYGTLVSKSGSTYTALRDLFLTDLTFSSSAILDMAGYKLYGTGICSGTGTIRNNGVVGGVGGDSNTSDAGTRGEGGTAGTAAPGITVPSAAAPGAGGRSDYDGGGAAAGSAGSNATLGYNSTAGSAGGAGGNSGGAGGAGGTVTTATKWKPNATPNLCQWFHFSGSTLTVLQVAPGSGGGGGGALPGGAGTPSGGGGGGGGGAGGFLFVAFRTIAASVAFQAQGAAGGAGGQGLNGTARTGGGGGGGGNGGIILLVYLVASGYTTSVTGGAGGAGGVATGGSSNFNGTAGSAGSSGTVITVQLP